MRILVEPRHGADYHAILRLARTAEQHGFDAFFRSDHLLGVDPDDPHTVPSEAWSTLAGLARDTRRIRFGTLLTAATFRSPGLLATIVATVDAMSDGRVELGLGTGWYEREHRAFGVPFPAVGTRFDRLGEQLSIITGLWSTPAGQRFSFEGSHYRIDDCPAPPRPRQSPRPPVIVGGAGPRRTPELAARFADEFNVTFGTGARARFDTFTRICAEVGRDPATVRRSVILPVACGSTRQEWMRRADVMGSEVMRSNAACGTPSHVVDRIGELAGDGADTVYFHIYDVDDLDHLELLGSEVLPAFGGRAAPTLLLDTPPG